MRCIRPDPRRTRRCSLGDGYHRLAGARQAGLAEVECDVRDGTQRDAILHSVGANATHGLRRTNADKRRAVETLLNDDEWSKMSDREIGRRCGVTHDFVGAVKRSLSGDGRQIATERTVRRGDSKNTMNIANIGKKAPPPRYASDPQPDPADDVGIGWVAYEPVASAS